jgi:predicted nucleotide-binding protein
MQKSKAYRWTKFDAKTITAADKAFRRLAAKKFSYSSLKVELKEEHWTFNTFEEFLAVMDQGERSAFAMWGDSSVHLSVMDLVTVCDVSVTASTREEIESVFEVFDHNAERCRLPESETEEDEEEPEEPKVFIGHGNNSQWRDLKDHLHEKHEYDVVAYEIGSRAGHTIRDILEDMLDESSFALLVMTGEDEMKDGKVLARQNVVHEAGLFQGRLGFNRAIVLLEEGTEEFSNIHGIQQIRFAKGRIAETYGEVLAVLKREME